MSVYLSPIAQDQQLDSNGNPLVGGYWEVYAAGTTTPVTTYTSSTGLTPQAAQILLDASGRPANPIWLTGGTPVKFRLYSAAAVLLLTIDNVSGINDPASSSTTPSEWLVYGATATYIGATSFSVAGDQTGTFQVGRRLKTTNTGGTIYSTITASVYGAVTTVTVTNDSGTLDSGLSVVAYGILAPTNPSAPALGIAQTRQNVTGSRTLGVTYTNSTGRPISVAVTCSITAIGNSVQLTAGAESYTGTSAYTGTAASNVFGIILPGETYSAAITAGGGSITKWIETR